MSIQITALYAAILGAFFIVFSFYVSSVRAKTGVSTGDGGDIEMIVAMRRHGNMAESTPFALLLMALAEANGLSSLWIHIAGLSLIAGRLIHPYGISVEGGNFPARIVGQSATYVAMAIPAISIVLVGVF